MDAIKLIDEVKKTGGFENDAQVAKALGINRSRISQIRKGIAGKMGYATALKALLIIGKRGDEAMIEAAEITKEETLLKLLKKGGKASAIFFPVAVTAASILEKSYMLILC